MARPIPSTVVAVAHRELKRLGFQKFDKYHVALQLNPDATAFIQVAVTRTPSGSVETDFSLSASFGLRIHSLHKTLAALAGWGDSPNFIGIAYRLAAPDTNLSPKTWHLSKSSLAADLSPFIAEVRGSVLPLLMEVSSPVEFCKRALAPDHERTQFSWQRHWWTPVAYITLGNTSAALEFAEAELASARVAHGPDAPYTLAYQKFFNAMRAASQDA